jgi:hypothetical protein
MAKVRITPKISPAPISRPDLTEKDQTSGNGNWLAVVKQTITAATWSEGTSELTVGTGKVTLLSVGGDDKPQEFGGEVDCYNYSQEEVEAGEQAFVFVEESQADGKLYVVQGGGGAALYKFVLTEDMGATTPDEAAGTITKPDGSGSESATLKDHPAGIFSILVSGREGWALKAGGEYWIIQANCPPPDYESGTGDGSLSGDGTFIYT